MDMPAFNLKNKISLKEIESIDLDKTMDKSIKSSFDSVIKEIIDTPAIKETIEKLSKE